MFFKNYQAIRIFISYFLLLSTTFPSSEERGLDSLSAKSSQDVPGSSNKQFDSEFKEFEEKLKRLKQILAEESQKAQKTTSPAIKETQKSAQHSTTPSQQPTTPSQTPQPNLQNSTEQNPHQNWFKPKLEDAKAAIYNLDTRIYDVLDMFNPINFVPATDDLLKPFRALSDATQHFIPEPFSLSVDIQKKMEKLSKLMTRDVPQVLQRVPESLEGMISSMDIMRKNSTELARNQTISLFDKISKNIFVWSVLMAQTDLMATLSIGLMYRASIHVLKATPLPTEVMKLQTSLNTVTYHLSKTIPITIKILSSGPFGDIKDDLDQLVININETNRAMDALQNQTNILQQIMDRTPTTSNVLDQQSLNQFQTSMVNLVEVLQKMPHIIPLISSLVFNQNAYLLEFLGHLSNTLMENGVGWKASENIQNLQKRIQEIFNIKDSIPFLNTTNPIGKAFTNLLVNLQSLLFAMKTTLFSPSAIISFRTIIVAIDGCVEAIRSLQSLQSFIPPILLQPLLMLLETMSKFFKYGINSKQ